MAKYRFDAVHEVALTMAAITLLAFRQERRRIEYLEKTIFSLLLMYTDYSHCQINDRLFK